MRKRFPHSNGVYVCKTEYPLAYLVSKLTIGKDTVNAEAKYLVKACKFAFISQSNRTLK